MPRYTLGQFKQLYSWPEFLNLDSADARWLLILNEAVERLMNMGLWCGTYQRYQVCTREACLTWPRQFQTIEVVGVCGGPTTIRNQWFEFLDQGPGLWRGGQNCSNGVCCPTYNYLDRGRGFVMFDDTRAASSRLRFATQFAADAGKVINVRGLDDTGNWVLTNNGNTVGEDVTLINGSVDTVTNWGPQVFREVIKAKTKGFVTVNSYDTAVGDSVLYPMARWEPTETIPDYRRCVIPSLQNAAGCGSLGTNGDTECPPSVTVMAKLAFIPLENDLDILPLTNGPAIKLAMLSVQKQERGDYEGARAAMHGTFNPVTRRFQDGAVPLLDEELAVFQGSGAVAPLRIERGLDTAGVVNLI